MNWQPFIRASWEMVLESEGRTSVYLEEEVEAYLVHMMARNFRNTDFPPDVICLQFAHAKTRDDYMRIGDGCLFVDAWDVRRARLVEKSYYSKMGQIAYSSAAIVSKPVDELFDRVAKDFGLLSRVLRGLKPQALRMAIPGT